MSSCLGSIFTFLIFVITLVVVIKMGLFNAMGGSLSMFNDLLVEVFKSLISVITNGSVYTPETNYF